jgi:hypothetical protein
VAIQSGDRKQGKSADEADVLSQVVGLLGSVGDDARRRIITAVSGFFDVHSRAARVDMPSFEAISPEHVSAFSADRTTSPKEFILQKQPKTDAEKVACLAYYLTHFRNLEHFTVADISKINAEAAQVKFGNPTDAVNNAVKAQYLVSETRGLKQLSARGEKFVLALPDRAAAKAALANQVRRRKKARRRT